MLVSKGTRSREIHGTGGWVAGNVEIIGQFPHTRADVDKFLSGASGRRGFGRMRLASTISVTQVSERYSASLSLGEEPLFDFGLKVKRDGHFLTADKH